MTNRPLRLLVADDSPADAELMVRALRRAGFDPEWSRVEDEEDYLEKLNAGVDVILSDCRMPRFDATRALELAREYAAGVPFLIVSGTIGEEAAVAAMREGAADYVLKDRMARLGQAVSMALDHAHAERERKRAEREAEALEIQLLQAQKMQSLGRLAGGIAHDFANYLTVIEGFSALALERMAPDTPAQPMLQQIKNASKRATHLVEQLLAFSRQQKLETTTFDLNLVVRSMDDMLGSFLGSRVAIVTCLAPGELLVVADRTRMDQVLMNLAVNARDAMPGGGTLTLETCYGDSEGGCRQCGAPLSAGAHACLLVRDTGIGMDEDVQRHLFEPFFTTKERGKGTGLGLATVHGIVLQSGGHVCVRSSPGAGAEFCVLLPQPDLIA